MIPGKRELEGLYVDQRLTTRAIAAHYGVEKTSVSRWLRSHGIPVRPSGNGLVARGIEPPSRDDLERMVHVEYLGYREIANKYGVDLTAVPYWLKAHGIRPHTAVESRTRGLQPKPPTREELTTRRAAGESLTFIATAYRVDRRVIGRLCNRYGLPVDRSGWLGGRLLVASDGHEVRSTYELRVDDWLTENGLTHELEPRYPFDRRYRADFKVADTFIEVWGVMHNSAYQQRREWKIQQCQALGLPLIQINYWQFAGSRRWWKPLELLRDHAHADGT